MTEQEERLALAEDYERGLKIALASGYEEFGPEWQRRHQLVIDALRRAAQRRLDNILQSATVSCSGLQISIDCNDHDIKDSIMDALTIRRDELGQTETEVYGAAPAQGAPRETFDVWFNRRFLDPDGGSKHLPDWLKYDLQSAWDAALTSTPAPRAPMAADIAQIISNGWLRGKSALETTEEILREFDAAPAERAPWQMIDTAPKDGTRLILGWDDSTTLPMHSEMGRFRSGTGRGSGWCNTYGHSFGGTPTHWLPLPVPPSTVTSTDGGSKC